MDGLSGEILFSNSLAAFRQYKITEGTHIKQTRPWLHIFPSGVAPRNRNLLFMMKPH